VTLDGAVIVVIVGGHLMFGSILADVKKQFFLILARS
jgi:hypothetical protein